MTTFAMNVWTEAQGLRDTARRWWDFHHEAGEDGLSETICRALANPEKFKGGNLAAWLTCILRNVRKDELTKGYKKRGGAACSATEPRMAYRGWFDEDELPIDPCDPESILIARELSGEI